MKQVHFEWADPVGPRAQDQDAEDEENREPDFSDDGGVRLHFVQQAAQEIPFAHFRTMLVTLPKSGNKMTTCPWVQWSSTTRPWTDMLQAKRFNHIFKQNKCEK